jgi:sorting nexin-1/2
VVDESPIADPLDSAARAADDDDDNEPLAKLRSPGFRESIPPIFSETATIRPPHDEDLDSPPLKLLTDNESTIPGLSTPTPEPASTSTVVHTSQPHSQSNSSFASPPPSATESSFKSPLEVPFSGLNRSMAGLSLGGEAQGGWHSAEVQTPWQAEQITPVPAKPSQGDDDSDDDRPILQSYHKQHEDKSSVSAHLPLVHNATQLETPKLASDADKN